ncbi:alpha/beta fold hydrolase [Streptomyces sp. NPDC004539]|uniref:thioesterase II family protein n=1 Tax=Streptomyces sp. NPDC004539 TaxID=3154280 RepID=UPI0033A1F918
MDRSTDESPLWLRCFTAAPEAPVQLVCLPHAGGSAGSYLSLSAALAPEVEVLAVQYPGRQDRRAERCADSIAELTDRLVRVLVAREDDRPMALFGHSMGAVLAFEIARRLEESGGARAPVALLVSGRRAPHLRGEDGDLRDDEGILRNVRLLDAATATALDDPDLRELVMPALRGDYRATETHVHVPGPPLRCPVVALTGDADPVAPVADVARWRPYTRGPFALHVFDGGHFYLTARSGEVGSVIHDHLVHAARQSCGRAAGPRP